MTDAPYLGPDTGADKGPNTDVDYNKVIVFPDPPEVIPFRDTQQLDDCLYYTRAAHRYTTLAGVTITIPADFHTDLLSIPQIAWTALGVTPGGYCDWAAIVHDYLYGLQGILPGLTPPFTRAECDGILLEILSRLQMPWLKCKLIYLAVRIGGSSHFKEK